MLIRLAIASGLIMLVVLTQATAQQSSAQLGITSSAGIAEIATNQESAHSFLGYEVNSFNGRKPKLALQLGVWYAIDLNKRFGLSTELLLSREGLKYENNRYYGLQGYQLTNYYLNIPITLQLRTNIAREKYSALYLVPHAGVLLHSSRKIYDLDFLEKDSPENMKPLVFSAGIGYMWDIGKTPGKWLMDLRFSYGITNTLSIPEDANTSYYNEGGLFARNTTSMLGVKYRLR